MTGEDKKKEFGAFFGAMAEAYGRELSTAALTAYWFVLHQYPISQIKAAVKKHTGSFIPTPGDITKQIEGVARVRGLEAWSELERAMVKHGAYTTVVFDNPITSKVVDDMGGWVRLCSGEINEWTQKEFVDRYEGAIQTGSHRDAPIEHLGLIESENNRKGYETQKGIRQIVGDQEAGRRLLAGKRGQFNGRSGARRFLKAVASRDGGAEGIPTTPPSIN